MEVFGSFFVSGTVPDPLRAVVPAPRGRAVVGCELGIDVPENAFDFRPSEVAPGIPSHASFRRFRLVEPAPVQVGRQRDHRVVPSPLPGECDLAEVGFERTAPRAAGSHAGGGRHGYGDGGGRGVEIGLGVVAQELEPGDVAAGGVARFPEVRRHVGADGGIERVVRAEVDVRADEQVDALLLRADLGEEDVRQPPALAHQLAGRARGVVDVDEEDTRVPRRLLALAPFGEEPVDGDAGQLALEPVGPVRLAGSGGRGDGGRRRGEAIARDEVENFPEGDTSDRSRVSHFPENMESVVFMFFHKKKILCRCSRLCLSGGVLFRQGRFFP